jgi:endoglucanase
MTASFTGFVRADGENLVDGTGQPVLLRGVGLGNWLLPEGYMWRLPGAASSPRQIEALVTDLVGAERAARFWTGFRDRFVTEADIARIAAEGFNHVRLAINSRVLVDEPDGFDLIDRLIDWCRTHRLWVLLDLHGAPGGQTGTNIDDSPNGRPELFEQPHYREQTLRLWTMIARRYADEPVVLGYDLLNEPLPGDYQHRYADALAELYRDLTAAIRAVDPHHLIVYEGSHWATNWDIFTEVWDENSMLQFHKYWSPPDLPSIRSYVDIGARLGLPIYMGEGGENNLDWIQTAFQLFSDHGISWNFWPWKKIGTVTSPCSVAVPAGWEAVRAWAAGTGPKPGAEAAWATLMDCLGKVELASCTYRPEVVNAMLRRAPLRLPATGFTFRGPGHSYHVPGTGQPLAGFRADDGVTVRGVEPEFGHNDGRPRAEGELLAVELAAGDWVAYEVNVAAPAVLEVIVDGAGDPALAFDGVALPATGRTAGPVEPGCHTLRVTATADRTTFTAIDVRVG